MTALRWLEWPIPRRTDNVPIAIAHVFVTRGRVLDEKALCGASFPQARVVGMAPLNGAHNRCWVCDEQLRTRNGPHPKLLTLGDATCYTPRYTFEDWTMS
jgi:hypothetical protein